MRGVAWECFVSSKFLNKTEANVVGRVWADSALFLLPLQSKENRSGYVAGVGCERFVSVKLLIKLCGGF